jgi:hypothetical protein
MALALVVILVHLHVDTKASGGGAALILVAAVLGTGVVVGLIVKLLTRRSEVLVVDETDTTARWDLEDSQRQRWLRARPVVALPFVLLRRGGAAVIGSILVVELLALLGGLFAVQSGSVLGFLVAGVALGVLGDRVGCFVVPRTLDGAVMLQYRYGAARFQRGVTQMLALVTSLLGVVVTAGVGLVLGSSVLVIELGMLFCVPAVLCVVVGSVCVRLVRLEESVVGAERSLVGEILYGSVLPLFIFAALTPLLQLRGALVHGSDLLSPTISAAFFLLLFPLAGSAWIARRSARKG